jgi:hypothetical protein
MKAICQIGFIRAGSPLRTTLSAIRHVRALIANEEQNAVALEPVGDSHVRAAVRAEW